VQRVLNWEKGETVQDRTVAFRPGSERGHVDEVLGRGRGVKCIRGFPWGAHYRPTSTKGGRYGGRSPGGGQIEKGGKKNEERSGRRG